MNVLEAKVNQLVRLGYDEKKARKFILAELNDEGPPRIITVRLPRSLHEKLKEESKEKGISLNSLCLEKLEC